MKEKYVTRVNSVKAESAFTLIELLVTIAILGIVAIIALPAASQIRTANEKTSYQAYGKSLLTAGKQYNDSYNNDLFGTVKSGCVEVDYDEIRAINLIKDIQLPNTTCNAEREVDGELENTKVRIWKSGDKFDYEIFMLCTKEEEVVYSTNNWDPTEKCEISMAGDFTPPAFDVEMRWEKGKPVDQPYDVVDNKSVDALVTIADNTGRATGLKYPLQVDYQWQFKNHGENEEDEYTGEETEEAEEDEEEGTTDDEDIGDDDDTEDGETSSEDYEEEVGFENIGSKGTLTIENTGTNNRSIATATITAPEKIKERDLEGEVRIIVTAKRIYDNSDNQAKGAVADTISIKNANDEPDTAGKPKIVACKWKNVDTKPSKCDKSLGIYTSGTWFSGNVRTEATGGGSNVDYYYSTDGKTGKETNKGPDSDRNILANGTSKIRYKACVKGTQNCSGWTNWFIVKLDKVKPTCSISKSNTGKTSGVTLKTVCKDSLSKVAKCAGVTKTSYPKKTTVTNKKIKKSKTYEAIDRAGNKKSCSKTVTAQKQRRTRTWNNCKTSSQSCSCPSDYKSVGGICSISSQHPSQGDCLKSKCHKKGGSCQNLPSYNTPAKWACNITTSPTCKTICTSSGWNAWSSWKNVSSCKKSNTAQCRTIYK